MSDTHTLTTEERSYGHLSAERLRIGGTAYAGLVSLGKGSLVAMPAMIAADARGLAPTIDAAMGDTVVMREHTFRIVSVPIPGGRRQDTMPALKVLLW